MNSRIAVILFIMSICVINTGVLAAGPEIVVGSKKFTENVILGEIATQLLRGNGITTRYRQELGGTRILWGALLAGQIDVYPEYTGTMMEEIFSGEGIRDVNVLTEKLQGLGIGMTEPLGFNNTYILGMKEVQADKLGISSISDLKVHAGLVMGFTNEFLSRGDGWLALRAYYGLPHANVRGLDHDLAYRGLESGDIDVMDLYSTDAEIEYYTLRRLQDDRSFFPDYHAVFLYRMDIEDTHPGARALLDTLNYRIDDDRMTLLNRRVKIDRREVQEVAASFLQQTLDLSRKYTTSTLADRLTRNTLDHLYLVTVSLLAAILVAVPLGVCASRNSRARKLLLGSSSIVQTIPALAMFVFLIPFLGIGTAPAIVALFLYSLLPVLRNTVSGMDDIAGELTDSAVALGLPSRQRLLWIELPLATRSIMAGIKTAAVINVGLATLGALIGAGGYGQPILTGIRLDDIGLILEGAVPAALLALLVQWCFELVENKLLPQY